MRLVRYLEIFVIGGDPSKGQLYANVYNTSLVPGFDGKTTKDSSPQAYVEGINVGEIKQRFNALQATLNGPKLWMLDWADVPLGAEHDFNGKRLPWIGTLHLTPAMALQMRKEGATQGHVPGAIERKTKFGYRKGTLVFLIDDADGKHLGHEVRANRCEAAVHVRRVCCQRSPTVQEATAWPDVPYQGAG